MAGDARLPCLVIDPVNGNLPRGCSLFSPSTGFGHTVSNLFNSTAPDKGVAIQIDIPIRNRVAQATQIRSQLEYRQAELGIKQFESQVSIRVRNDQFALEQNRARVVAAREAQQLAEKTLDAEQKK